MTENETDTVSHAAPAKPASWHERWTIWRNRWLADAKFQRLAMRTPLLRGTARGHAGALFGLVTGFVYTQTLTACVDLGIIASLSDAPLGVDFLALKTGLGDDALRRLLAAAAALDLVEMLPGDRVALGVRGAALAANPGALAMIEHHKLLYADLADPVALLRRGRGGGRLAGFWPYAEHSGAGTPDDSAQSTGSDAYSRLMAASQPMVAEQLLDAHDFRKYRKLLDIGGGHGAFLADVAARHPQLGLALFDLPAVATGARQALAKRGLDNVEIIAGSFRDDALPGGADVISLVRILHDHDDAVVTALLAKVHAALPPGGTLLIAEPMAGTRGAEAMGDAYFGLYLWAMGSGRPRSVDIYRTMLAAAGFRHIHEARTALPMVTRLIVARR